VNRILFLPVAILATLIGARLHLGYLGFAILVGITIPFFSLLVGENEMLISASFGCFLMGVGVALLLIAYSISIHYGLTFEALDQDRTFLKPIRRLPCFGIASISAGVTSIALSHFRQR
jgi:uncharacterized membrane protein